MHGATIPEVPAAGSKLEPRGFQGVVSHNPDPFLRSVDIAFGPPGDPGKVIFRASLRHFVAPGGTSEEENLRSSPPK